MFASTAWNFAYGNATRQFDRRAEMGARRHARDRAIVGKIPPITSAIPVRSTWGIERQRMRSNRLDCGLRPPVAFSQTVAATARDYAA
jgi:hypothetical protein